MAQRALWLERLNERCCWLLWDGRAVDDQLAILNLDHIPGQTNNTLDEICIIGGMAEDGNITTLGQCLEDAAGEGTHRERAAVTRIAIGHFIDKQEITDQQRVFHRSGRDPKWLKEQGAKDPCNQQRVDNRFDRLANSLFFCLIACHAFCPIR